MRRGGAEGLQRGERFGRPARRIEFFLQQRCAKIREQDTRLDAKKKSLPLAVFAKTKDAIHSAEVEHMTTVGYRAGRDAGTAALHRYACALRCGMRQRLPDLVGRGRKGNAFGAAIFGSEALVETIIVDINN